MKTKDQIIGEINARLNILQQKDYISRKIAFDTAKALKTINPDVNIPSYDEYKQIEEDADIIRQEINELREELNNVEE